MPAERANKPLTFVITFLCLFALLYGFYVGYLSIVTPGGPYFKFLDKHLNFIQGLRHVLLQSSSGILQLLGYTTKTTDIEMLVVGHNVILVGYDCLGFGVMCFFIAFVLAYPATLKGKLIFGIAGLLCIQALNLCRFMLLALYWRHSKVYISDHHTIYNIVMYIIIAISLYFYIRRQDKLLAMRT
ncbi:hypothetical protein FPZ43_17170 [Mucilaginibacter pallidiroseus]|uniref:Exosortase/archaeosortase family protein n=1 Tax=Mucilaginibacter pallidiroseus TaxID=2599295 RepID=A0A563U1Z3_9SPHI|nr:archaeosortase/exosortase family protein [Mucilaginibacter pallidiroseus]TWR25202.1 hypothetical protein FPZ43_17170 [Mucilaginibacter pallidiroseus]